MLYMTPQSSPTQSFQSLSSERWGQIMTPKRWSNHIQDGRLWCMDNGIFTGKFEEVSFWSKLDRVQQYKKTCLFVVAPDVVSNAIATMSAWRYWGMQIKEHGWPVAFAAQDGQELFDFPPDFDALFIGGSTEWKMSNHALDCIKRAKALGKWVHVGRVNSQKRIRHFQLAGVDSVDGTSVCFAPDKNYQVLNRALMARPLFTI